MYSQRRQSSSPEKLTGNIKNTTIGRHTGSVFLRRILIVPFIRLYTKGITDVNYIQPAFAWVFLLAEAVNCLVLPCSSLPVAADHLKQTRWGAYSEALINIILSCILIKWEPLLGVAIGTLVATVFRAIYYMAYSAKEYIASADS